MLLQKNKNGKNNVQKEFFRTMTIEKLLLN